ncbi:hypothetical protein [Paludisphaera borealis]|uniref:Uncharacterized protein n=1 Tax=Paludisphaera borealis TaxID=1387353 RepID=A0A1U7CWI3_9BACT|nr:hypothetical protein [Paludisphaera borealis]APW63258.1 hypothetical protein BSF38_04822 [Paludisphaera borealis]
MRHQDSKKRPWHEEATPPEHADADALDGRFYVLAPSVNAVRRALFRAPGGAKVVGRHDRETIACSHTMDAHSLARHWSILVSRLGKAGLRVVPRPGSVDNRIRHEI